MASSYGRRLIPISPGRALYRPVGEDHLDHYDASMDCLSLLLPGNDGLRTLSEPVVIDDTAFARAAWALRMEADASDSASELIAEGLATLVSSVVLHRAPVMERSAPRWIGRVREQLEDSYDAPPSLTQLAHSVDRDPAYVAATFQRVYGASVGSYLRRLRLWQARDKFDADPACGLSDVAQSPAHTGRVIRVGTAPLRSLGRVSRAPTCGR